MKLSQKLLLLLIGTILLLCITLTHATPLSDNDLSDADLDLDDDDEIATPDVSGDNAEVTDENDVPEAFDMENLTEEQIEMIRRYQQQQQQQQEIFSSPDVEPSWVMPPRNSRRLPLGSESKLVLGFTNTGSDTFQVLGVRGAIVSPQDYNFVIQNLTVTRYNSTVQPEETNALMYEFVPDKRLDVDPREYGMMVMVYYMNEDNTTFATTFFNETVTFYDANSGVIDFQRIFMFLILIGLAVGAGYVTMQRAAKKAGGTSGSGGARKAKAAASSPQEESAEVDMSLIPARLRKRFQQGGSPSSPRAASPKSAGSR